MKRSRRAHGDHAGASAGLRSWLRTRAATGQIGLHIAELQKMLTFLLVMSAQMATFSYALVTLTRCDAWHGRVARLGRAAFSTRQPALVGR